MKRTILYLLIALVLIGLSTLLLYQVLLHVRPVALEDALVSTEDLSDIDLHILYRETAGADYYDLPISEEIAQTIRAHLVGEYKRDKDRTLFLTSTVTKYVDSATPHLEESKNTIVDNLGKEPLDEVFAPVFETSSFYQYKECARVNQPEDEKVYVMCVVSSTIGENYLFTLVLHGNGEMTNNEIESILEAALHGKQDLLQRLSR